VDCPAWNPVNQAFLQAQGGVDWLFLTHRGGMGQVREIQAALQCQVAVQEQEAYLLPGLSLVTFERSLTLTADIHALWTAGHSPGSACLYDRNSSGVLFTGRHLLPNPQGQLMPLKTAKTFHWRRQLQNVQQVLDTFTPETLQTICPGANLGFLRGRQKVDRAYEQLAQLDLEALESAR
jgi:glyoxylase-like metal-dependent hydrolase (beta-lactamase superfamily II)